MPSPNHTSPGARPPVPCRLRACAAGPPRVRAASPAERATPPSPRATPRSRRPSGAPPRERSLAWRRSARRRGSSRACRARRSCRRAGRPDERHGGDHRRHNAYDHHHDLERNHRCSFRPGEPQIHLLAPVAIGVRPPAVVDQRPAKVLSLASRRASTYREFCDLRGNDARLPARGVDRRRVRPARRVGAARRRADRRPSLGGPEAGDAASCSRPAGTAHPSPTLAASRGGTSLTGRSVMPKNSTIVACPNCGRKNRVLASTSGVPRCSVCHTLLPWIVEDRPRHVRARSSMPRCRCWSTSGRPGAARAGWSRHWSSGVGPRARGAAEGGQAEHRRGARRSPTATRVRGIPLLVLFRDGSEVARQVGAVPQPQLNAWLRPHLAPAARTA